MNHSTDEDVSKVISEVGGAMQSRCQLYMRAREDTVADTIHGQVKQTKQWQGGSRTLGKDP